MDGFTSPGDTYNTETSHGMELGRAVRMWPTPRAHDGTSGGDKPSSHPQSGGEGLQGAASRHAPTTPTDGLTGSPKADLNPRFVASLMGVPWDWLTPSTSAATGSSPSAPLPHSANSPTDWSDNP